MPRILAESDLFVFPTKFEGFPFALLEAMRAGVPAVATAAPGVEEILGDGRNARVIDEATPRSIATAVTWALSNPGEMRGMAERASRMAAEFNEERMLSETLSTLKDAMRCSAEGWSEAGQ